jgi:drug/metabolite transporter superfamily protein YnfA
MLKLALVYILAALAEIGGCFSFWLWLREGKSVWWFVCRATIRMRKRVNQDEKSLAGRLSEVNPRFELPGGDLD